MRTEFGLRRWNVKTSWLRTMSPQAGPVCTTVKRNRKAFPNLKAARDFATTNKIANEFEAHLL